ncbi:MAG: OB-fold domain-containing protein [Gammaproteobacteria bacterium]|nr:OB-fold domain-containing protein [Gammaproteobacteria bacterium]
MAAGVDAGRLLLPRCRDCGIVQYPLRELCRNCLGDTLDWVPVSGDGTLLSWTNVHTSLEPFFADHAPWPVGRVKLECGPLVIAHLAIASPDTGMRVRVLPHRDLSDVAVLIIVPESDAAVTGPVADLLPDVP